MWKDQKRKNLRIETAKRKCSSVSADQWCARNTFFRASSEEKKGGGGLNVDDFHVVSVRIKISPVLFRRKKIPLLFRLRKKYLAKDWLWLNGSWHALLQSHSGISLKEKNWCILGELIASTSEVLNSVLKLFGLNPAKKQDLSASDNWLQLTDWKQQYIKGSKAMKLLDSPQKRGNTIMFCRTIHQKLKISYQKWRCQFHSVVSLEITHIRIVIYQLMNYFHQFKIICLNFSKFIGRLFEVGRFINLF